VEKGGTLKKTRGTDIQDFPAKKFILDKIHRPNFKKEKYPNRQQESPKNTGSPLDYQITKLDTEIMELSHQIYNEFRLIGD
jgi:hypothetical protein